MLNIGIRIRTLVVIAFAASCQSALPQSGGSTTRGSETHGTPEMEAILGQQLEQSLPGEEMRGLSVLVGAWSADVRLLVWPQGGIELPATIATGVTNIRPVLNGRFLEWETRLTWSAAEIESKAWLGFDQGSERYQFWRTSELSSAQTVYAGSGDPARGGLYLERTQSDGGQVSRLRTVLRLLGPDGFELEELGYDSARAEWVAARITSYRRLAADGSTRDDGHEVGHQHEPDAEQYE